MRKPRRRIVYAVAFIFVLALAVVYWYFRHGSQGVHHPLRASQHDAATATDTQMLEGKFGDTVSAEDRQIVLRELQAPDHSFPTSTRGSGTDASAGKQQGKQHIMLTQPLRTTVEETEPTLTWDAVIDGWSYRVHVEDRDSHQTVVTSPVLDEAIWRFPTPLLRGHAYLWRVDASPNGAAATTATSPTAPFSVLSDDGEREIQKARAGNASHLLLGSLYSHYEMWHDAVLEYRKLVDDVPNSPDAIKLLRNAEIRSNAQLAAGMPQ